MVRLGTQGYLAVMFYQIQGLFRRFGHIKHYRLEILIVFAYFLFCGYFVYFYVFRPTIVLLINTSDFECSTLDKYLFVILGVWQEIAWPLSYLLIYVGIVCQMSYIQE